MYGLYIISLKKTYKKILDKKLVGEGINNGSKTSSTFLKN